MGWVPSVADVNVPENVVVPFPTQFTAFTPFDAITSPITVI
jgi:hypothetical protein